MADFTTIRDIELGHVDLMAKDGIIEFLLRGNQALNLSLAETNQLILQIVVPLFGEFTGLLREFSSLSQQ